MRGAVHHRSFSIFRFRVLPGDTRVDVVSGNKDLGVKRALPPPSCLQTQVQALCAKKLRTCTRTRNRILLEPRAGFYLVLNLYFAAS